MMESASEDQKVVDEIKEERKAKSKPKKRVVESEAPLESFVKSKKLKVNKPPKSEKRGKSLKLDKNALIGLGAAALAIGVAGLAYNNRLNKPTPPMPGANNPAPAQTARPPAQLPTIVPRPPVNNPNAAPFP